MILFILILGLIYDMTILVVMQRENRRLLLNIHNIFGLIFSVTFSILFPLVCYYTQKGFNTDSFTQYIMSYSEIDILVYFICFLIVTHTYLYCIRNGNCSYVFVEGQNYSESYCGCINKTNLNNKLLVVAIIMLLIGVLADYLYLKVYGGYSGYLVYANAIRSGVISISNPFSFLIIFRDCVVFSSILFFPIVYDNKHFDLIKLILFFTSVFFSIRVLISNGGRLTLILYLAIFIVYIVKNKQSYKYINLKIIALSVLGIILFLGALVIIGNMLSRNISDGTIALFIKEFSFIFVNFKVELSNANFDTFRYFIDILLFPIYLLPSSVWKGKWNINTASSINTLFCSGAVKGSNGLYGEMPVDMISLSYMQLGIFGIFVIPIVYVFILRKLLDFSNKIININVKKIIKIYIVVIAGIEAFFYADPLHIISSIFPYIVFMILYNIILRVKI